MKKRFLVVICIVLSTLFLFVAACTPKDNGDDEEYTLDLEPGMRQITIYYQCSTGYDDRDVWFWYDGADGKGYEFHACEYGAKFVANIPAAISSVNFIIRKGCVPGSSNWSGVSKDGTDSDRSVKLEGDYTVIYTKENDPNSYMSSDGGKTLEIIKSISLADMQDPTHIKVTTSDGGALSKEDIKVKSGEQEVSVASVSNGIITLSEALNLSKPYTLEIKGYDPVGVVPMTYFSSAAFASAYTYSGELGVELKANETIFRLWAPTASSVKLNVFDAGNGGSATRTVDMTKGEKGVWTHTANENLNGKYYTYTVATSLGVQEAVDPYARSAGLNGQRGMILDLDSTDPDGWDPTPFDNPAVENYTDAEIWEVHVRDFSNTITNSNYRGKYLAFTETGLKNKNGLPVGVDYLKELGITHVHLLPSFDYASVDESKEGGFNWGYDPQNYNVPEGSYSTDPTDGAKRVNEYKRMVQALHNAGISVVMDVVYNHTYSLDSNLNKIVPYYYYRYGSDGTPSNGSGCGNETASERSMMRRYMVDSIKYWQEEYNLDGFRFDLMGVHDITTLQAIEKAVHERNPEALIYGEGWTGGTVALDEKQQGILANLSTLNANTSAGGRNGIAMFNDVIRDGLKGSVFNIEDTGFATGARADYLDKVLFGVTGNCATDFGEGNGWYASNPTQVINYASAHDNNTLWDRICHVYGEEAATLQKRTAMNRLTAAIVQTSLGIPFMQAGEEMLRAKKNADGTYNENSYNSSDAVNNIKWDELASDSEQYKMMQYYKGLIAFRKDSTVLRQITANVSRTEYVCELVQKINKIAFVEFTMFNKSTGEKLLVVYNAENKPVDFTLPAGSWNLYINGTQAGTTPILPNQSGAQTAEAISCYVYRLAA